MNIEITDPEKYSNVKKVCNYGAKLVDDNYVDGHLSITYTEDDSEYNLASFGIKNNKDLEEEYGFRFVSHENNIDNGKYYFI